MSDAIEPALQDTFVKVMVADIASAAAKEFQITRVDLVSARRSQNLVDARHITMYLARRLTRMSLPEIGRILGGRDHTTVLHGVRRIEASLAASAPRFADEVRRVRASALERAMRRASEAAGVSDGIEGKQQ